MAVYFHCTFASRVKSILQQGLVTGKRRTWSNMFNRRQGRQDVIYMMSDFTAAVRWAFEMEYQFERPTAIIMFSEDDDDVTPDPHIQAQLAGSGTWKMTQKSVPSNQILRVIPLTIDLKKEVGQTGKATLPE
jgi:hypothetical protein